MIKLRWTIPLRLESSFWLWIFSQYSSLACAHSNGRRWHLADVNMILWPHCINLFSFSLHGACSYFIVITVSTVCVSPKFDALQVGYGDIVPHTDLGKIFIIAMIAFAFSTLPSLVNGIVDGYRAGRGAHPFTRAFHIPDGYRSYVSTGVPFVVILLSHSKDQFLHDVYHASIDSVRDFEHFNCATFFSCC